MEVSENIRDDKWIELQNEAKQTFNEIITYLKNQNLLNSHNDNYDFMMTLEAMKKNNTNSNLTRFYYILKTFEEKFNKFFGRQGYYAFVDEKTGELFFTKAFDFISILQDDIVKSQGKGKTKDYSNFGRIGFSNVIEKLAENKITYKIPSFYQTMMKRYRLPISREHKNLSKTESVNQTYYWMDLNSRHYQKIVPGDINEHIASLVLDETNKDQYESYEKMDGETGIKTFLDKYNSSIHNSIPGVSQGDIQITQNGKTLEVQVKGRDFSLESFVSLLKIVYFVGFIAAKNNPFDKAKISEQVTAIINQENLFKNDEKARQRFLRKYGELFNNQKIFLEI